jgi:hypothetical protein
MARVGERHGRSFDGARRHRPPRPSLSHAPSRADPVIRLQRAAGNDAVRRLFGPRPRVPIRTSADEERVPIATSETERRVPIRAGRGRSGAVSDALGTLAAALERGARAARERTRKALAAANASLSEAEVVELRRKTGDRIGFAYTAYVSACKDVRAAIKAAAEQDVRMLTAIFEIATGFLAPGLARGLAGWASRIPVESSAVTYRAAMAALDTDTTARIFTSAAGVGAQIMNDNAVALAGETDTDAFVRRLERVTQTAFQRISDDLGERTPAELGVVAAMFDASVANVDVYRAEIKRLVDKFRREVEPIGYQPPQFGTGGGSMVFPIGLAYIEDGGFTRLGLVQYRSHLFGGDYWFHGWVSDHMKPLAIERARAEQRAIKTLELSDLKGVR